MSFYAQKIRKTFSVEIQRFMKNSRLSTFQIVVWALFCRISTFWDSFQPWREALLIRLFALVIQKWHINHVKEFRQEFSVHAIAVSVSGVTCWPDFILWGTVRHVHATIIFDPLDIGQFWFRSYNVLFFNILHTDKEQGAPVKTPFHCYLLALF